MLSQKITLSLLILFVSHTVFASSFKGIVTQASGKHHQAKGSVCTFIINDNTSTEREISAFLVFGQNAEFGETLDFKKLKGIRPERLVGYDYAMDKITEFRHPSQYGGTISAQNHKNHLLNYSLDDEGNKTIKVSLTNANYSNSLTDDIPGYYDLTCKITVIENPGETAE